jgi:hypothetical protein
MNGRNALATVLLILFACITAAFVQENKQAAPSVGLALPSGSALFETSLQSSISSSDTSMTLVSVSLRGSETLTGYQCFTIDEGRSDAEYVCGTVSGSTVSSLERGISLSTGTTTIAALKFRHRTGADVKITDYPLIQRMRSQLNGSDTIPNLISYTAGTDCTAGHSTAVICTGAYLEAYANAVIAGGAPTSTATVGGKVLLASQLQMASSTDLGVSAPLVLQAKYATSSPGSAGLWAVVTNNAGKIAQAFIDLTASYAWTGAHTFSSGLTANGTTTVLASSLTTNPFVFGGLAYKAPTIRGVAGSTFTEDGAGTLTMSIPQGAKYTYATTTDITVSLGNATSTSITIPAGFLTASSTIQVKGGLYCLHNGSASVGNCGVLLKAGNVTIAGTAGLFFPIANVSMTIDGNFEGDVVLNNSLSSQTGIMRYAGSWTNNAASDASNIGTTETTSTVDFSQAVTLSVVINSSNAQDTAGLRNALIVVTK